MQQVPQSPDSLHLTRRVHSAAPEAGLCNFSRVRAKILLHYLVTVSFYFPANFQQTVAAGQFEPSLKRERSAVRVTRNSCSLRRWVSSPCSEKNRSPLKDHVKWKAEVTYSVKAVRSAHDLWILFLFLAGLTNSAGSTEIFLKTVGSQIRTAD